MRLRPAQLDFSATTRRLRSRALALGRGTAERLHLVPPTSRDEPSLDPAAARRRTVARRRLALRLASERAIPVGVSVVVLLAGVVSLGPVIARPVGAVQAQEQAPRIAIGGTSGSSGVTEYDPAELSGALNFEGVGAGTVEDLDDGTLFKPVAVDTSVQSSSGKLRKYTVRTGDTLAAISDRYHVAVSTIWWANRLTTKDLKVGQSLVIPPMNGLVVTVALGDTLDSLAAKYELDPEAIVSANQLEDRNLIVGQVLMLPGAKGAPLPTLAPTQKPRVASSSSSSNTTFRYTGGAWHWPVVGGGNYVSQYFHSGHPGVDIAADYGTPIVAPLAGRVIFAGWKSNGGGYQVWLSLGNGIYTAMYHMSAVNVSGGAVVSRGQQIGRIGTSGWATGPHCHFEVWIGGAPWSGSAYRVNALRYY